MFIDILGWIFFVVGLLSAAALAYYPLRHEELMPKKWAVLAVVFFGISQFGNQYIQSRQQTELKGALDQARDSVQAQLEQLKRQEGKLAEGQLLITRLSSEVKNQSLKQEASLYMLNQSVSNLSAKTEPYGNGQYGTGRYGGTAGPLEKIADTLISLTRQVREYFDDRHLNEIRFDPKMQGIKYLQLIKNIPADYDDPSWRAAEDVIFKMLSDEASANLQRRNIYTPEWYERNISVLKAERDRMLRARERAKK